MSQEVYTDLEKQEITFPPHIQRLRDEQRELVDKMDKLYLFMENSPIYKNLSTLDKALLTVQYKAMDTYNECLKQRIIFS